MARRSDRDYGYWSWYESGRTIRADGIKAKSKRGEFSQSWWGKRWLEALTALMDPGRLSRGRSYARRGQVLEINLAPGSIAARVQGSRPTPYVVTIELRPLRDRDWEEVLDALAGQAIFAAELLIGEMPADIGQVFEEIGIPLFPRREDDLETDCSCPDWANPCKHIAAVYHLLAERFDEDPFLLFELRGRDKEQIMAGLRERRADTHDEGEEPAPYALHDIEPVAALPLTECLDDYWGSRGTEPITVRIAPPTVELAALKRTGLPDFVDAKFFRAQMERIYAAVTARALDIAFGDRE